jgi:hypothetical protein
LFIAIDPGANTGVATFTNEGKDLKRTVMREAEFLKFLKLLYSTVYAQAVDNPESKVGLTFIIEDFNLRKDKAIDQVGSNMPSSQIIGAVKMIDNLLDERSEIIMQRPDVLSTALKWAGFPRYANNRHLHPPDDIAAYSHGVFHLINAGLRKHPIFDE